MKRHIPFLSRFSGLRLAVLTAVALLGLAAAGPARAQTNSLKSEQSSHRYLLVVETSRAVQRRADGMLNAVMDLLASGMKGQLRPGDTIGIWTFAEDLYTGRFPLQHWSPQENRAILSRAATFLREQTYDKQASLDKVLPAVDRLVKISPLITVILITDGEEGLRGTPFDNQINQTYKSWRERQQQAQMPFLTVLRGKQGTLTDFSVTAAPWPVDMPPLPPEVQVAGVAPAEKTVYTNAPAATVPSLIFHGKKPAAPKVEASVSAPALTNTAAVATPSATQSPAPLVSAAGAGVQAKVVAPPSPPVPAQLDSSKAPVLLAKAEPLPYQLPKLVPTPGTPAAGDKPAPAQASVAKPPPPPPPALHPSSPAPSAMVTPPRPAANRRGLWLAALVLVTALAGLALILMRRARPPAQASLITRSLEREHQ